MTVHTSGRATSSTGWSRFVDLVLEYEFAIAFVALTVLVTLPVFLVDVPPLADYVNHLARMRVIAVEGTDPDLSAFYRIDWQLIPNLAMDLIVPVLDRFFDIYRAGQIFTVLTLVAMVTGPMAVHKALYGRFNAFPLVAFVLVFNGVLLFGMMNYLLGVGLAMWGLAAWIAIRERSLVLRLVVSAVFCFLLYVCHLYAVGLYGLAIGSYELWAWARRRFRFDRALAIDLVALIVPVLPLVPLLMRSATWGLVKEAVWDSQSKIEGIELVFRTYVDTHDLALLALGGVALAWALKRGVLSAHGAAAPLAVFGFAVFLAMPYTLFGSEMADQRMPVALLLMLVGFVHLDPEDKWFKAGFLALVIGFAGLRVADVSSHWQRIGAIYADIRASLGSVPRGSKILVAVADEPKGTETAQSSISHAPCLAIIERSALVSTAFTVKGKQIMTTRPPYDERVDTEDGEPPRVSQLVATAYVRDDDAPRDHFWDKWTVEDDYVFVLYTEREADNPDPSNLDLVWDGRNFQLYKVKKDGGEDARNRLAPEPARKSG
jgi:hypothetical protein